MICEFKGRYEFLSNFYRHRFVFGGVTWTSSEHAFQAMKTLDPEWRRRIMVSALPREAKRLGRAAPLRGGWDEIKYPIMDAIVTAKFFADEDLADMLLATGDQILVEGNTWGDRTWGAVYARELASGEQAWKLDAGGPDVHLVGANLLGKALMHVRGDLRVDRELRLVMIERETVERELCGPALPVIV